MKYEIGQEVWQATWDAQPARVECPDCAGTARVRVMLPDDTIVSIECEGCRRGYEPSTGWLRVFDRKPIAKLVTIAGVEIENGKTEWRTSASYRVEECNLFDNEADAMTRAQAMAQEADREERDRVNQKERPLKSWAWHAHYHRREIKDAQRRIEHHTARLAVANKKAKADKPALSSTMGEAT